MKAVGIVCEYNPFHNGHEYHIQKTRQLSQCDVVVCVMSGNFVQRGEPAIINKWERAACAIKHGADLIIELPFLYAVQSATYFANAAVHLLAQAKVEKICFGSESNNLDQLKSLAKKEIVLNHDRSQSCVQIYETLYGTLHSNDILALNYIKACNDYSIEPLCIQRTNDYLDSSLTGHISSATSIRKAIKNHQDVTSATSMEIKHPIFLENYYSLIQYLLLTLDKEYLASLFLMEEGMENLLIKNASASNFETFMQGCISKKYTRSRIQRTLIHLLNHTTKKQAQIDLPHYLRVLAFNEKGQAYLKEISPYVSIASRFNQIPSPFKEMEWKANQVYAQGFSKELQKFLLQQELQPPLRCSSF